MKTCPVGTESFRADRQVDGRTDRHDEANSHFSQFYEKRLTVKRFWVSNARINKEPHNK